ncbi:hypothetical protein B2J89_20715, partial [Acidovorax sp. SRB_24]|nr:hypothetical protein [Acidovorax sp. SRB_24]
LAVQGHRPYHHGLLRLLAGPHRVEAGWWTVPEEGGAAAAVRDYFVAHNDTVGLVWVYRERLGPQAQAPGPYRWFLQGLYA